MQLNLPVPTDVRQARALERIADSLEQICEKLNQSSH